jgi:large subunit ribosomal protein L17
MRHLVSGHKLGKQPARPLAERMITLGKRDSLHARRQAASFLTTPGATKKLFSDLAPRFADRPGGYTRIVRVGWRIGDGAELAILEFIGSELKKKEKKPRKTVEEEVPEEKEASAKK